MNKYFVCKRGCTDQPASMDRTSHGLHGSTSCCASCFVKPIAKVIGMGKFLPQGLRNPWTDFDET